MSKLDKSHPLMIWIKAQGTTCIALSLQMGKSPSCVSRWVRGERIPSPADQDAIARITGNAVPVSFWHQQAIRRAETCR